MPSPLTGSYPPWTAMVAAAYPASSSPGICSLLPPVHAIACWAGFYRRSERRTDQETPRNAQASAGSLGRRCKRGRVRDCLFHGDLEDEVVVADVVGKLERAPLLEPVGERCGAVHGDILSLGLRLFVAERFLVRTLRLQHHFVLFGAFVDDFEFDAAPNCEGRLIGFDPLIVHDDVDGVVHWLVSGAIPLDDEAFGQTAGYVCADGGLGTVRAQNRDSAIGRSGFLPQPDRNAAVWRGHTVDLAARKHTGELARPCHDDCMLLGLKFGKRDVDGRLADAGQRAHRCPTRGPPGATRKPV